MPRQAGGAARVLALQRSAGNHSVSARLARDPDTAKDEKSDSAGLAIVPEIGTIPVLSVSFGEPRRSTAAGPSGGGSSKGPFIRDITLVSRVGEHSPKLARALTAGKPATVEIVMPSMSLTLRGAMISSYTTASGGADPTESWSLNFESFEQK
ncbi:MAG: type VI secretion system tube protein Hcp [Actinomycetota bacterium]|nr:type VI secretion system tube protein Hcp [Actinomycetota bacterium]